MFLRENCMFLGEKCIFFGENAWISENQEGFALENVLNFRIYIYKITVLRTVLTDFKNKHDLDIYDLRNAQNFAKIL